MYVRLAFAVAAHLDTEILVIDEVLAVGDSQFQKKCLENGAGEQDGRKNSSVRQPPDGNCCAVCTSAILLHNGEIAKKGETSDVIAYYMKQQTGESLSFEATSSASKEISIIRAESLDDGGNPTSLFTHLQPITIAITCRVNKWIGGTEVRIAVRDSRRNVFTTDTPLIFDNSKQSGTIIAKAVIPGNLLRPETYYLTLAVYIPNQSGYRSGPRCILCQGH